MYLLRITYNGVPILLEVEIEEKVALFKKEICNPYGRLYDKAYKFIESHVIKSNINIPKTSDFGQTLYSEDLSVLQKVVIDYIMGE